MVRTSVAVVNYNGRQFLDALFNSLANQTLPPDEVIMVDNASTDGSVGHIREQFPLVRVIAMSVNTGFAEGNNIALAAAGGEYVALVNSDAVVDREWLAELVGALDADERVGAAVPKIFTAARRSTIEQAGADFNNLGHCWTRGFNQSDEEEFNRRVEVPVLTGCSVLVRRRALAEEPLFDRDFFMYYEELDLSLRLRGRGYSILYVPTAVAYHAGMQSVRRATMQPDLFQQFYCNRNRAKILAKYYPSALLIRNLPLIVLSLAYWDYVFLRHAGPALCIRAVVAQVRYALQGLVERVRGSGVEAQQWLPWMTRQGLCEVLAVGAARRNVE